jgi:hypothetical protein
MPPSSDSSLTSSRQRLPWTTIIGVGAIVIGLITVVVMLLIGDLESMRRDIADQRRDLRDFNEKLHVLSDRLNAAAFEQARFEDAVTRGSVDGLRDLCVFLKGDFIEAQSICDLHNGRTLRVRDASKKPPSP